MIGQSDIVTQAMEVSPFSSYVYGFLVAILLLAIYYLARELKTEQKANREFRERTLKALMQAEQKMESAVELEKMKTMLHDVVQYIKGLQA